MSRSVVPTPAEGLRALRRAGTVTELLFLYECTTVEVTQLRPVAERLGLTVQAVSNVFRALVRRGLIERRGGQYRPTVEGVAWLHEGLAGVADDVRERLAHLYVVRSTRARAEAPIAKGSAVSLELVDGLLSARPGAAGASRGVARVGAPAGGLVEVERLEGIVPITPAEISVVTIAEDEIDDPGTRARLREAVPSTSALVAAEGLEAYLLLRRAWDGPILRFAVASASAEAARVGVSATVFVLERDLSRLFANWGGGRPPSVDVRALRSVRRAGRPERGRAETGAELRRRGDHGRAVRA